MKREIAQILMIVLAVVVFVGTAFGGVIYICYSEFSNPPIVQIVFFTLLIITLLGIMVSAVIQVAESFYHDSEQPNKFLDSRLVKKTFGDKFKYINTYGATILLYNAETKIKYLWVNDKHFSHLVRLLDEDGQPQYYNSEEEESQ